MRVRGTSCAQPSAVLTCAAVVDLASAASQSTIDVAVSTRAILASEFELNAAVDDLLPFEAFAKVDYPLNGDSSADGEISSELHFVMGDTIDVQAQVL